MIIPIPYYDLICFEMYGKKSDAFNGIVTIEQIASTWKLSYQECLDKIKTENKLYNGNYLKLIKGYAKPTQRNPKQDVEEVTGLKKIPMVASQSIKVNAKNVRRVNGKFVIVE